MVRNSHRKRMRRNNTTRRYRKLRQKRKHHSVRRKHKRRHRTTHKQRGGYNRNKHGNINFLSVDKRYRPVGGIMDTINYNSKKLMNNIQGKYKPVNPNVSSQPIGDPLSVKNLKFGVGSTSEAQSLFNEATLRASSFPN
tara:strand:- start:173 stop:589 length:417 start_codon:yes stop_codon:yes gene_type:complete